MSPNTSYCKLTDKGGCEEGNENIGPPIKNKGGNNSKSIHLSNSGIIFHTLSIKFRNLDNKNRLLNIANQSNELPR